ncbi:hypothetical protein SAY86_005115 [Trapa natans]|uniref:NAB domain-containing protein n=1 Tax=Trapa natans TaxID=22666 RepID=A0AAN7KZF7_TRANT|nr:hypothetical protein SAY86_005115 [Trapa natans]
MAAVAPRNTRRMYSWWWDSHISPKNSKWLQENLTDMDMKVKQMIKLLEEDADSFARRAEMYYKKRPELMKLVEEFYRAYRALAERYDNATGVLRQAHKTMAEAFPNQVPLILTDDPNPEFDPQTPDPSFASNTGGFIEDSDPMPGRKGLKQFSSGSFSSGEGRVRQSISFHDSGEKKDLRDEEEIASLKKDLARLEAEKEAGIIQYQQSLEESKKFSEQLQQANAEIRSLQDSITRLEEEKSGSLLKYQQCLDKIGEIETLMRESNDESDSVKAEAEALKRDLAKMEAEKEAALGKYSECLDVISGLEEKLRNTEAEIERLKEELAKLMETISDLEHKLYLAEEEARMLRLDINDRAEKLKISEERYLALEDSNQTLHSELESRSRELVEKQNELGNLWTCVQEERARFVEAETAFQTLQHLHSQSLEELRSLAVGIQTRDQIFKDMEAQNQNLQGEVERILDENKNLNEVNLSSSLTVKNLQEELLNLREMIQKLEQEIELRVNERNSLQQEIYCLKEEVNGLNEKNRGLEEQVDSNLSEKAALLEKLAIMEKLIEKNLLLENSLSDLNVELEGVREKVKTLEESCKFILGERDSLDSQLNLMTQNFENLKEKNNFLENSLCDANAEVDTLRTKSKILESSCLSLSEEKSGLFAERDGLVVQLNESRKSLKDLQKRFQELEEICASVEKEKELILLEMGKLNETLTAQGEEYSGFIKSSKAQLCDMASRIHVLQDEAACRNNEYEEELEKHVFSQTEIFILQKSMEELKEKSNAKVVALMIKAKNLEGSCFSLDEEKSELIAERGRLILQLNESRESLKDLQKRFQELEEIHASVEKEKELILLEMGKLNETLSAQREEYSGFIKSSEAQLCDMASQIHVLQDEVSYKDNEYKEVLDEHLFSQTENFILQKSMKELKEKSDAKVVALMIKAKNLEDSCFSLDEEKSGLIAERDGLVLQLNESRESLKDLQKRFQVLEEIRASMEKEKELILIELGKLDETLSTQREEYSGFIKLNEAQLCDMASRIHVLQDEVACRDNEYGEELDKQVFSQTEIFILQKSMKELKEKSNANVVALMIKAKNLEDLCFSLDEEKSGLIAERDGLVLQLNESQESLKDLQKRFQELEEIRASMEKEKELILLEMDKLNETLSAQREEYSGFVKSSQAQLCDMSSRIHLLQEEVICRDNEYGEELEKNVYSQTEIFILQKSMKVLEEKSNAEVDALKIKSKRLEDSCFSLGEVKSGLIAERDSLVFQLNESQKSLKDLEKRFQELEEIHALVEKEKELILLEMGKLDDTLSAQREEYSGLIRSNEAQLCDMASQIHVLQEEVTCITNEYEEELAKNVYSQMEIFILQKSMKELEEKSLSLSFNFQKLVEASDHSKKQIYHFENRNVEQELELKALNDRLNEFYLWLYEVLGILDINVNHSFEHKMGQEAVEHIIRKINELQTEIFILQNCMKESEEKISSISLDCQKLTDASRDSERQISHLENAKSEQQVELKALTDHINELQLGLYQVFKVLHIDDKKGLIHENEVDRDAGKFIITEVKELQNSLAKIEEENLLGTIQELVLGTLLRQTEAEAAHLWTERCALGHNLRVQTEQFFSLQQELVFVLQSSEELRLEVLGRICREEVLHSEMTILHQRLSNIEAAFERLKEESSAILEEKHWLEDESYFIMGEKLSQTTVSVILEEVVRQNFVAFKKLVWELKKVHSENRELHQKIMLTEGNFHDIQMEKLELEGLLEKSENEVKLVTSVNEQLNSEVALVNETLGQLKKKLSEAAETVNVMENKNYELEKELENLKEQSASIFGKLIVSEICETLLKGKICESAAEFEKSSESSLREMEILKKMVATLQGENEDLNAKLAAHLMALVSLKDCMVSLESSLNRDEQKESDAQVVEDLEYVHDLERRLKTIETELLEKFAKLEGPSSTPMSGTGVGEGRLLTKDIMLDEASECSSYSISQRGTLGPDDHHALELWDTGGTPKLGYEAHKEHRSLNPSTDSLVNKLDFSEILSQTQSGSGDGKKRVRVMERLNSDVQKLTNLQINLEDLKRKLEFIEKNKKAEMDKAKGFEYGAVKGQLDEAEEAIAELFNDNRKLAKNLEEDHNETDRMGIRQKRVSEQARRGSEKLGRIQLELQRLQFLLLKLEDKIKSKEKSRFTDERSKKVLLRDYLYGSTGLRYPKRVDPGHKKVPFCGCAPRVIE